MDALTMCAHDSRCKIKKMNVWKLQNFPPKIIDNLSLEMGVTLVITLTKIPSHQRYSVKKRVL